jgi:hypothetical protein
LGDPLLYAGGIGLARAGASAAARTSLGSRKLVSAPRGSTAGILPQYLKPFRPPPGAPFSLSATGLQQIKIGDELIDTFSIGANRRNVVFQGPTQDFSNIPKGLVDIIDPTPQGLLQASRSNNPLSLRNLTLNSMARNLNANRIGPRETRLLDQMQASVAISGSGSIGQSGNIGGLATVIRSLAGDRSAQRLLNYKTDAYKDIFATRSSQNQSVQLLGEGKVANPEMVSVIHSSKHPLTRDGSGNIIMRPTGQYDQTIPRASIHFTLEDVVKSHMFGAWRPNEQKIVASLSSMINKNGLPYNLNPTDTWWMRSPGQDLAIPNAAIISPYTNSAQYSAELVRRGLLEPGKMPPIMAVDTAKKEVLHLLKDTYSPVDRFQIKRHTGTTAQPGREASLISEAALKKAKEMIGTDTRHRGLEMHGTTDAAFDESIRNLAISRQIDYGQHMGTGIEMLERLGHTELSSPSLYMRPGQVGSIEALRFAALKGLFKTPVVDLEKLRLERIADRDFTSRPALAMGGAVYRPMGGKIPYRPMGGVIPYKMQGGMFPSLGSDTIPAMLTPGEFVIRRPAVREIGVDNLEKLNRSGTIGGDSYNYSIEVNVKSESNPDQIARTVMDQIRRVDSQRIRGNRY